jgi:hypothetical protein
LVTERFVLRTALLFVRTAVRLVYVELAGASTGTHEPVPTHRVDQALE